jgi:hypothetical protein
MGDGLTSIYYYPAGSYSFISKDGIYCEVRITLNDSFIGSEPFRSWYHADLFHDGDCVSRGSSETSPRDAWFDAIDEYDFCHYTPNKLPSITAEWLDAYEQNTQISTDYRPLNVT